MFLKDSKLVAFPLLLLCHPISDGGFVPASRPNRVNSYSGTVSPPGTAFFQSVGFPVPNLAR
jgi:hypothetical protein